MMYVSTCDSNSLLKRPKCLLIFLADQSLATNALKHLMDQLEERIKFYKLIS